METCERRFQSFTKQKPSKPSKASSSKEPTWPHPDTFKATPRSLAEAGFYYNPSKDDPDNVECFICGKELGGWDDDDDPFEIHFRKCPKCPWALARCSLEFDLDENGEFVVKDQSRLPSNKVLEKARLDTFGGKKKWWPHDSVKGHGATSKLMAKAGFVYTPQSSGDDTATCFYCDLSLSGWDAEDDPLDEHRRREVRSEKRCPYFHATVQSPTAPESEAKAKPKRASSKKPKSAKDPPQEKAIGRVVEDEHAEVNKAVDVPPPKKTAKKPRATKGAARQEEEEAIDGAHDDAASELEPPPLKKSTNRKPKASKRTVSPELSTSVRDVQPVPPNDIQKHDIAPPNPHASTKLPASKASKAKRAKVSSQKDTPTEEEDGAEGFAPTETARPKSKPPSSRTQVSRKPSKSEKPPSNVNGKVSKGYKDIVVDVHTRDEPRKLAKSDRESRSRSRSRSRSAAPEEAGERSRVKKSKGKAKEVIVDMEVDVEEVQGDDPVAKEDAMMIDEAEGANATSKPRTLSKKSSTEHASRSHARIPSSSSSKKASSHEPEKESAEVGYKGNSSSQTAPETSSKRAWKTPTHVLASEHLSKADEASLVGDVSGPANKSAKLKVNKKTKPKPKPNGSDKSILISGDESDAAAELKERQRYVGPKPISKGHNTRTNAPDDRLEEVITDVVDEHHDHAREESIQAMVDGDEDVFRMRDEGGRKARIGSGYAMDVDVDVDAVIPTSKGASDPNGVPASAKIPPETARKDRDSDRDGDGNDSDADVDIDVDSDADIPSPIEQALSSIPLPYITSLTDDERAMTVEQWIRHEMAKQYEQLKQDGQRWIDAFRERSREARARIEAL